MAQIRLGRFGDAEQASKERASLPPNQFVATDPKDETSRAEVMRAHAVAMQGRLDEARAIIAPVLEYYRDWQSRGAAGVSFDRDVAYALYVNAVSQPTDSAGAARRAADLAQAAKMINGLSPEARRLADVQYVSEVIASAR
jgi:hypothetical protein